MIRYKFAIKGDEYKCDDIISVLTNIGGSFYYSIAGSKPDLYYYIDDNGNISAKKEEKLRQEDYELFSYETFKNRYPFVVGDVVKTLEGDTITIEGWSFSTHCLMYKGLYKGNRHGTFYSSSLKQANKNSDMNLVDRNKILAVSLTLEKASKWYREGGELKEMALQCFSENELKAYSLPSTWEDFCLTHDMKLGVEACVLDSSKIHVAQRNQRRHAKEDKTYLPSEEAANAHLALMQLHQLRDCYRMGWRPDWSLQTIKYCIESDGNDFAVVTTTTKKRFLTFQDPEIARLFVARFINLLKDAGDLV